MGVSLGSFQWNIGEMITLSCPSQIIWFGGSTLLFLEKWPEWLGSQMLRFSMETGLILAVSIACCPWAGQPEKDHFLFLLPLQPRIQLLMAEGPLKPPKIASCWREVIQCTPQSAYWFLFLVLIKIYFSSLQVNSDLGLAASHICSLGQWILVLTSGGINSCLLLRYFNVNKWPHGSGRGLRSKPSS